MTDKLRQAAEMALEALEDAETQNDSIEKWDRHALAKKALSQALSQDHGFDRTASHMAGEYVDTAQPEPVSWLVTGTNEETLAFATKSAADCYIKSFNNIFIDSDYKVMPLYTAPPKRKWVGLTDEDISKAKTLLKNNDPEYAIFFVMTRLQEYNTCL